MPFLSNALTDASEWMTRRRLRFAHRATLKAYENGNFEVDRPTISVSDALTKGVLNTGYLKGPQLERCIGQLDATVWSAWNESSKTLLDFYKRFYGADEAFLKQHVSSMYSNLMPFEKLLNNVLNQKDAAGKLPFVQWLHALQDPWRPLDWQPASLVGESVEIGQWALNKLGSLGLSSTTSAQLAHHLLVPESHAPLFANRPSWVGRTNRHVFSVYDWPKTKDKQSDVVAYAERLLDVLLPPAQWGWRRRWELIGKEFRVVSGDTIHACVQGAQMAALLHDAPVDIQIVLCAFKGARHPHEPPEGHPDAQCIRHHFFEEPPPVASPSPIISAAFLCVGGVDPDMEVDFFLEQLTRDPTVPLEAYPLDALEL